MRRSDDTSVTWARFSEAAPDLAAFGKRRLEKRIAYLATLRSDGGPRVHPISPIIAQGHLLVYMEPTSPKGHDLRRDARYALHCSVEDNSGGAGEFHIRGRALVIDDLAMRDKAFDEARAIGYNPRERYVLFELEIEEALATIYQDGSVARTKWKAS